MLLRVSPLYFRVRLRVQTVRTPTTTFIILPAIAWDGGMCMIFVLGQVFPFLCCSFHPGVFIRLWTGDVTFLFFSGVSEPHGPASVLQFGTMKGGWKLYWQGPTIKHLSWRAFSSGIFCVAVLFEIARFPQLQTFKRRMCAQLWSGVACGQYWVIFLRWKPG